MNRKLELTTVQNETILAVVGGIGGLLSCWLSDLIVHINEQILNFTNPMENQSSYA